MGARVPPNDATAWRRFHLSVRIPMPDVTHEGVQHLSTFGAYCLEAAGKARSGGPVGLSACQREIEKTYYENDGAFPSSEVDCWRRPSLVISPSRSSSEVAGVAAETGGAVTGIENRTFSLRLIAEVVRRGLMEVGELDPVRRGFRKWDMLPEEALSRIERAWRPKVPDPRSEEVCWLNNTAKGERHGKRLLRPLQ
jgi:hypothetical protein